MSADYKKTMILSATIPLFIRSRWCSLRCCPELFFLSGREISLKSPMTFARPMRVVCLVPNGNVCWQLVNVRMTRLKAFLYFGIKTMTDFSSKVFTESVHAVWFLSVSCGVLYFRSLYQDALGLAYWPIVANDALNKWGYLLLSHFDFSMSYVEIYH